MEKKRQFDSSHIALSNYDPTFHLLYVGLPVSKPMYIQRANGG